MNDPKELVNNVEIESELSYEVGHTIERRVTYLRQAYVLALEHIHDTPITWRWYFEQAIVKLGTVGIKNISCYQSITDWNRKFRRNKRFF